MRPDQLKSFRAWFKQYVEECLSHNPDSKAWIKLKDNHTERVCEKIVRIGKSLNFKKEELLLAETTALFHDVGRFRQIEKYRTFNDRKSENHALLGLQVLEEYGVLTPLDGEEQKIITTAIGLHNLRDLPEHLQDRYLIFTNLIRDADKLDILETFARYYRGENKDLDTALDSYLPDTPGYSQVLVESVLQRQRCHYEDINNRNDRKILNLSWIYDINFLYTLSEIYSQGYLDKIIEVLPRTGDIERIHRRLKAYIKGRLPSP
ncbi:MAG: HD domain-containing protein [Desulfocucumaceae bacterium]